MKSHGDSRDGYGYAPTIIGLVLLALMAVAVYAFDPGGAPLPTCETTASCNYHGVTR